MRKRVSKKLQREKLQLNKETLRRLSPHELSIPRGGDETEQGCIDTSTCGTIDTTINLMTAVLIQTFHCTVRQATCE